MICSKCGKEIADGSKFCGFCGASTMPAAPVNPAAPIPEATPVAPVMPAPAAPVPEAVPVAPVPETPVSPAPEAAPVTPVAEAPAAAPVPEATPAAPVMPTPVAPVSAATPVTPVNPTPVAPAFQAQTPVAPAQAAPAPAAKQPKKKGKGGLIAGIIAAVVVLIGGGLVAFFLFFGNPTGKIEKALGEGDVAQVVELYNKLKSDKDKDKADELILAYTQDIEEQFMNEEIDYDKASSELGELAKALADNKTLSKRIARVEEINSSREEYKIAEDMVASGKWKDYINAIEHYEAVSSDDEKYYDKAQDAIQDCKEQYKKAAIEEAESLVDAGDYDGALALLDEAYYVYYDYEFSEKSYEILAAQSDALIQECVDDAHTAIAEGRYGDARKIVKEAMDEYGYDYRLQDVLSQIPTDNTLVGTWYMEYDLSNELANSMGDEFEGFDAELMLNIYFEFNDDGTMKMYADPEQFKDSFGTWQEKFIDFAIDMIYEEFKAGGISKKEADKLINDEYGMTMKEYLVQLFDEEMDIDALLGEMQVEAYYVVEGDKLGISEDGYDFSYDTFSIDGDALIITSVSEEELTSALAGMKYPLTLYRLYDNIE